MLVSLVILFICLDQKLLFNKGRASSLPALSMWLARSPAGIKWPSVWPSGVVLLCVSVSPHHLLRPEQHHCQQQVCCSIKAFLGFAGFMEFLSDLFSSVTISALSSPMSGFRGTLRLIQPSRSTYWSAPCDLPDPKLPYQLNYSDWPPLFPEVGSLYPRPISGLPYLVDCCGPEVLSAC